MLNIAARLSIFFGDKGFFIKHLLGEFGGCLATYAEIKRGVQWQLKHCASLERFALA
jgi:hypothetical protein